MLSTLLNYRLYASDLTKSLQRVQADTQVANDTKYYDEKIGQVKTVDEFMSDTRLYNYALKAYGLEDQAGSKAFIRKVVESDLSDSTSFANALSDSRYRLFAEAFNFNKTAAVATVQSTGQKEAMVEAYSEHRVRQGAALALKTDYFESKIATIGSVDAFLNDSTLFEVAMLSIGADPALISKSYVRGVLTGATSDDAASSSDDKFFALADKMNFASDGSVTAGAPAMTAEKAERLVYDFNVARDNLASSQSAARETKYFLAKAATATAVGDLTGDPRIASYLVTAFRLDSTTSAAYIASILTSDPADPNSVLAKASTATPAQVDYKEKLVALNAAFTFTPQGTVPSGGNALAQPSGEAVTAKYHDSYQTAALAKDASKTETFTFLAVNIMSVGDLLAKSAVFGRDALDYVLKAFDIDPATASLTKIRRVLQSDVSDPESYVNKLGDKRYETLAAAFNFGADGKAATQRQVQSDDRITRVGTAYKASFGADLTDARKSLITEETKKYITAIGDAHKLDDVLASDTIIDFSLKAFGLEKEKLSADQLRKLLTSDLGDPKSYANAFNDSRYVDFAQSFNFDTDGLVTRGSDSIQQPALRLSTENKYLLTTMEQKAGETSEGARLALYFLRQAPTLTTPLKLLADSAILEVVKTALGLPSELSSLDVDKQVAIIEKKLDVKDLQDPKKLDKFIARFAALYDLNNADLTAGSPYLGLFSQPAGLLGVF
ncbi:flagella associated protein [Aureimonas sp. SA4125]|uniref:DUF1217 domain-containing protein n=1 Tax=Aureimonas sp. SA4125 TaxID=2826993 RepID=UPI001CC82B4A|nr:DUF1217 domain-containing protein [Aureimonas sp. SA4125]BDA85909.1 flagella associated protein [Aureimonas sp. SA4125]